MSFTVIHVSQFQAAGKNPTGFSAIQLAVCPYKMEFDILVKDSAFATSRQQNLLSIAANGIVRAGGSTTSNTSSSVASSSSSRFYSADSVRK
jgi:hypothetical protein